MNIVTLAADSDSLIERAKWFFSPEIQKTVIPMVIFYVLIWTFIRKGKLTDYEKNFKKARAEGRVIKATLVTNHLSVAEYHGLNDNKTRYFSYTYVHPLTGKTKRYSYPIQHSGLTPPDEIEIYYNEAGKVFQKKEESRRVGFWVAFGMIAPIILTGIVNSFI